MSQIGLTDIEILAIMAERIGNSELASEIRKIGACKQNLPLNYFTTDESGIADSGFADRDFKSLSEMQADLQKRKLREKLIG